MILLYTGVTLAWTLWVSLMAIFPTPFADENLRAIVRFGVVFLPTLYFILVVNHQDFLDHLLLRHNVLKGILVGTAIAGIYLGGFIVLRRPSEFVMPILFQYVVQFYLLLRLLKKRCIEALFFNNLRYASLIGRRQPGVLSRFGFPIPHLDFDLNHSRIPDLIASFGEIFFYGVVFALLLRVTRSLWAPLAAHWLNNFILAGVGL